MNNTYKLKFIFGYFFMLYFPIIFAPFLKLFSEVIQNNFDLFFLFCTLYILFLTYKNKFLTIIIGIKIILFSLLLILLLFTDRLIIQISLCGMDGVGYLQRSGIVNYNYSCSEFTLYENFIIDFISSIYYPIYIFIFIKPFVNHLTKSMEGIKKK